MMGCRTTSVVTLVVLALNCLAQQPPASAKDAENPGITQKQADEILNELRAIRKLLERQSIPSMPSQMPAAPQTGKLRLQGGYSFGSKDAPITVVEFTDYQCPYCRQFHDTTFAQLRKNYVDPGKIRIVIRDLPLDIHADAMRAAEAAYCAGDQGQFEGMHDALFADSGKLTDSALVAYANSLKLDAAVFRSCLQSEKHKPDIERDITVAASFQINGTPSFVIGKPVGEELSGTIIVGAQPLSVFEGKFKEALAPH